MSTRTSSVKAHQVELLPQDKTYQNELKQSIRCVISALNKTMCTFNKVDREPLEDHYDVTFEHGLTTLIKDAERLLTGIDRLLVKRVRKAVPFRLVRRDLLMELLRDLEQEEREESFE